MAKPVDGPDDWWLAVMWVTDAEGVVSFRDVAPAAGPPPEPPLARMGPSFAGGLSGLIREEDGRLAIRLTPLVPPDDDARPWRCPLVIRVAFRWEPALAATLRPNQIADRVLGAFGRVRRGPGPTLTGPPGHRRAGPPGSGPPIRPRLRAMGDLFDEFMRELERRRAQGRAGALDDKADAAGTTTTTTMPRPMTPMTPRASDGRRTTPRPKMTRPCRRRR